MTREVMKKKHIETHPGFDSDPIHGDDLGRH